MTGIPDDSSMETVLTASICSNPIKTKNALNQLKRGGKKNRSGEL
jgi:hypothetical protein